MPGDTLDLAPAQSVFLALGGFIEPLVVEQVLPVAPPVENVPKKAPAKKPEPKPAPVTNPQPAPAPKEEKMP